MDNIAASGSSFESNNVIKSEIGNTLDKYESLVLYCPFKEKKPHLKVLSKREIRKIERKARKPLCLFLIIYDTSTFLFDKQHEVEVDRNCTIDEFTRMFLNEEVASKIHVRHRTISLPSYLTISPSVFP
jgi:hypothetical protein